MMLMMGAGTISKSQKRICPLGAGFEQAREPRHRRLENTRTVSRGPRGLIEQPDFANAAAPAHGVHGSGDEVAQSPAVRLRPMLRSSHVAA